MIPRPHDSHMETRPAHGRDCALPDPHFTAAFSMGSIQQKWNSDEGCLPETGPYPPWVAALGRFALTFDRNGDDRLRQISIVPYSSPAVQGDETSVSHRLRG